MRVALISDIHANLEALTAVIESIADQNIDRILCLGDVIGYGSDPSPCLELVNRTCDVKLMGNHEYAALGMLSSEYYHNDARKSAEWTHQRLTDYDLSIISTFEMDHTFEDIYLVHASPHEPQRWHYILQPEMAHLAFQHMNTNLCFFGHSHLPMIFVESPGQLPRVKAGHDFVPDRDNRYLVNVGSVGQPRDSDPRACYAIFDSKEYDVTFARVPYDVEVTQRKMKKARLPEMLIERLSVGR